MTVLSLNNHTLSEMIAAIDHGEYDAEAIINACYDRIEARQPSVAAWQYLLTRDQYLEIYHAGRVFFKDSPLKGLPVGIKDIIDTAEMPTEMGSRLHLGRRPVDDASCVAQLRQAGGIILGKTVTTEFAYFKPGATANPRDLNRTPGGSSSGSAAAVADDMVPVALGSQTAASVIRPAAYCGVVGYVGTRGEFSLRGVQPIAQSLDSLGFFARSVEDVVLLRSVLLGTGVSGAAVARTPPPLPTRILICDGVSIGDIDEDMQMAMSDFADELKQCSVQIVKLDSCDLLKRLVSCHETVMAYEAYRNLVFERQHLDALSEPLRDMLDRGQQMSRAEYLRALETVENIKRWLWQQHPDVDAILAPSAPGAAPEGLSSTGKPHMSRPWQAMGLPVINLPGLKNRAGLPLGVQLIGRAREDDGLLQVARWLQKTLEGREK